MSDLTPKLFRFVLNGTNPGLLLQIRFSVHFGSVSRFVLFRANLTHFAAKSDITGLNVGQRYKQVYYLYSVLQIVLFGAFFRRCLVLSQESSNSGSPTSGMYMINALATTRSTTFLLQVSLFFDSLIAFFQSISIFRSLVITLAFLHSSTLL